MTIHLNTVMEGLSPEQRQRVDDRVAELIAEDPNLQDMDRLLNDRNSTLRYGLFIQWSMTDQAFVVHFPEFPEPKFVTQGSTYEEAFQNGLNSLHQIIQSYLLEGRELPSVLSADRWQSLPERESLQYT
jgi:antitoxin HicB